MMNETVFLSGVFLMLSFAGAGYAQTATPSPTPKECDVASSREVDTRPKIHAKPEPNFTMPERARYRGRQIVLRATLCGSGKVTDIGVNEGLTDAMNAAAIEAARLIQFTPAEKDGKKVSRPVTLKYFVKD